MPSSQGPFDELLYRTALPEKTLDISTAGRPLLVIILADLREPRERAICMAILPFRVASTAVMPPFHWVADGLSTAGGYLAFKSYHGAYGI